jgi:hypothetical protein
MTIDFVFLLMMVTVGGGMLHAMWNLRETRRLREAGEDPQPLPRAWRKYRNPAELEGA